MITLQVLKTSSWSLKAGHPLTSSRWKTDPKRTAVGLAYKKLGLTNSVCDLGQRLGSPVVPFYHFSFGSEGSPSKIDYSEKWVPTSSNLSTGGPS